LRSGSAGDSGRTAGYRPLKRDDTACPAGNCESGRRRIGRTDARGPLRVSACGSERRGAGHRCHSGAPRDHFSRGGPQRFCILPPEVRILAATVPGVRTRQTEPLPDMRRRADEAAMAPLLQYTGRHGEGPEPTAAAKATPIAQGPPATLREVIRRNAEQDMALA